MLVEATGVYAHDILRRDAREYTRLRQSKLDVVRLGPNLPLWADYRFPRRIPRQYSWRRSRNAVDYDHDENRKNLPQGDQALSEPRRTGMILPSSSKYFK